ncbi:MAG: type II toxin-antitoxin system PemK/MazF family toxin [Coriobacteriales bacterium]|jgi:mRNA interferase MazF|nr:type II toxin-antitoxin system PemK/MazF family toxin [Coriobacteriales bacterium]
MSGLYCQGDLIEADFSSSSGHEPAKRRPALVVSVDEFNNLISSLTVVCPITSVDTGHTMHIAIPAHNAVGGYICVEQLRAVDLKTRKAESLDGSLDADTMALVLETIGAIFGI